MIHAKILNFRGILSAELELSPLCLVAGKNHQGKSSIAQAIAAAVTNSPVPFFMSAKPESALFNKTETKELVNANAKNKQGGVRLFTDDDNRIQIAWPDQQVKIDGSPPQCGKVPAGLVMPVEMGDVDRANFFSQVLKSNPTKEDFLIALGEAGYPIKGNETALAETWESIDVSGWDSVHKRVREEGARKKGAWEKVAGTKYGADKAADFRPASYTDDLADVTLDSIIADTAQCRQKVQDLNVGVALDADQIQRLTADALKETELETLGLNAKERHSAAKKRLEKAEAALAPLRMPHVFACQHCGAMNKATFQKDGTFTVEQSDLKDADIKRMSEERVIAAQERDAADKELHTINLERRELKTKYDAVEGSGEKLKGAVEKTGNTDALAAAQDELRTFEARFVAKRTYDEARELHKDVAKNQILINILDSTGLRSKKLQERLQMFNNVLAGYCKTAGYQPVKIREDLDTIMGDRHYMLLSDSEKYRCRAVIQVAAAVYEGSNFAIFDGADILDGPGRNGLLQLLSSLAPAFHALIAMTIGKPENVPDLAKAGIGATYWISAGTCGPLPVKVAA